MVGVSGGHPQPGCSRCRPRGTGRMRADAEKTLNINKVSARGMLGEWTEPT